MATSFKHSLAQRFNRLRAHLRHAFAVAPEGQPLSVDDVALIERVADAVIQRNMAAPATMLLESIGPMNFIGSQALHFFTPFFEVVVPQRDIERVAHLLERRDTLSRLIAIIESRSEPPRNAARS